MSEHKNTPPRVDASHQEPNQEPAHVCHCGGSCGGGEHCACRQREKHAHIIATGTGNDTFILPNKE